MPRTEIFRHGEDVSVVTTATDERDFVDTFSESLVGLSHDIHRIPSAKGDKVPPEGSVPKAVAAGFEILAKLRGYKAPGVQERRMLASGRWPHPTENPIGVGGEDEPAES